MIALFKDPKDCHNRRELRKKYLSGKGDLEIVHYWRFFRQREDKEWLEMLGGFLAKEELDRTSCLPC